MKIKNINFEDSNIVIQEASEIRSNKTPVSRVAMMKTASFANTDGVTSPCFEESEFYYRYTSEKIQIICPKILGSDKYIEIISYGKSFSLDFQRENSKQIEAHFQNNIIAYENVYPDVSLQIKLQKDNILIEYIFFKNMEHFSHKISLQSLNFVPIIENKTIIINDNIDNFSYLTLANNDNSIRYIKLEKNCYNIHDICLDAYEITASSEERKVISLTLECVKTQKKQFLRIYNYFGSDDDVKNKRNEINQESDYVELQLLQGDNYKDIVMNLNLETFLDKYNVDINNISSAYLNLSLYDVIINNNSSVDVKMTNNVLPESEVIFTVSEMNNDQNKLNITDVLKYSLDKYINNKEIKEIEFHIHVISEAIYHYTRIVQTPIFDVTGTKIIGYNKKGVPETIYKMLKSKTKKSDFENLFSLELLENSFNTTVNNVLAVNSKNNEFQLGTYEKLQFKPNSKKISLIHDLFINNMKNIDLNFSIINDVRIPLDMAHTCGFNSHSKFGFQSQLYYDFSHDKITLTNEEFDSIDYKIKYYYLKDDKEKIYLTKDQTYYDYSLKLKTVVKGVEYYVYFEILDSDGNKLTSLVNFSQLLYANNLKNKRYDFSMNSNNKILETIQFVNNKMKMPYCYNIETIREEQPDNILFDGFYSINPASVLDVVDYYNYKYFEVSPDSNGYVVNNTKKDGKTKDTLYYVNGNHLMFYYSTQDIILNYAKDGIGTENDSTIPFFDSKEPTLEKIQFRTYYDNDLELDDFVENFNNEDLINLNKIIISKEKQLNQMATQFKSNVLTETSLNTSLLDTTISILKNKRQYAYYKDKIMNHYPVEDSVEEQAKSIVQDKCRNERSLLILNRQKQLQDEINTSFNQDNEELNCELQQLKETKSKLILELKEKGILFVRNVGSNFYAYNYYGKLISIFDQNEKEIVFTYKNSLLDSIIFDNNKVSFFYNKDNLLSYIVNYDGNEYKFDSTDNQLTISRKSDNEEEYFSRTNFDTDGNILNVNSNDMYRSTLQYTQGRLSNLVVNSSVESISEDFLLITSEHKITDVSFVYENNIYKVINNMNGFEEQVVLDAFGNEIIFSTKDSKNNINQKYCLYDFNNNLIFDLTFNKNTDILKQFSPNLGEVTNGINFNFSLIDDQNNLYLPKDLLEFDKIYGFLLKLDIERSYKSILKNIYVNVNLNYLNSDGTTYFKTFDYNYLTYFDGDFFIPFNIVNVENLQTISLEISYDAGGTVTLIKDTKIELFSCQGVINKYDMNENLVEQYDGEKCEYYDHFVNKTPLVVKTIYNNSTKLNKTTIVKKDSLNNNIYIREDDDVIENVYDKNNNLIISIMYNLKDPSNVRKTFYTYNENGYLADKSDGYELNFENKYENSNPNNKYYRLDSNTKNFISMIHSNNDLSSFVNFKYKLNKLVSIYNDKSKINIEYDSKARILSKKINGIGYSVVYEDNYSLRDDKVSFNKGTKETITFANNQIIERYYDDINNLVKIVHDGKNVYKQYDGKNRIKKVFYDETHYTITEYNSLDKVCKFEVFEINSNSESVKLESYDFQYSRVGKLESISCIGNNLFNIKEIVNDDTYQSNCEIVDLNTNNVIGSLKYDKDTFYRPVRVQNQLNNCKVQQEYSYLKKNGCTYDLIKQNSITFDGNLVDFIVNDYDRNKNLVKRSGTYSDETYSYDEQNRLIKEENSMLGITRNYVYDNNGNILQIKETKNNVSKINFFKYSSEPYKDQLVSFNDEKIHYDENGNPVIYRNKDTVFNSLGKMTRFGEYTISYDYLGRISTISGANEYLETFKYIGENLFRYSINNTTFDFIWAGGQVIGFTSGQNKYSYLKNELGDIIAIVDDSTKEIVGKYVYDAWGNCSVFDKNFDKDENKQSISNLNPFRYRSYFYQSNFNLYYLEQRYYDPETCRFISIDNLSVIDNSMNNPDGLNLYVYCYNNPLKYIDKKGNSAIAIIIGVIIGALVGALTSVSVQALNGEGINGWKVLISTIFGGFLGGIGTFLGGAVLVQSFTMIEGMFWYGMAQAMTNLMSYVLETAIDDDQFNLNKMFHETGIGFLEGFFGFLIGSKVGGFLGNKLDFKGYSKDVILNLIDSAVGYRKEIIKLIVVKIFEWKALLSGNSKEEKKMLA